MPASPDFKNLDPPFSFLLEGRSIVAFSPSNLQLVLEDDNPAQHMGIARTGLDSLRQLPEWSSSCFCHRSVFQSLVMFLWQTSLIGYSWHWSSRGSWEDLHSKSHGTFQQTLLHWWPWLEQRWASCQVWECQSLPTLQEQYQWYHFCRWWGRSKSVSVGWTGAPENAIQSFQ